MWMARALAGAPVEATLIGDVFERNAEFLAFDLPQHMGHDGARVRHRGIVRRDRHLSVLPERTLLRQRFGPEHVEGRAGEVDHGDHGDVHLAAEGRDVPIRGACVVAEDEHPRPGTTIDNMARLKPAFSKAGSVTAGNASGNSRWSLWLPFR